MVIYIKTKLPYSEPNGHRPTERAPLKILLKVIYGNFGPLNATKVAHCLPQRVCLYLCLGRGGTQLKQKATRTRKHCLCTFINKKCSRAHVEGPTLAVHPPPPNPFPIHKAPYLVPCESKRQFQSPSLTINLHTQHLHFLQTLAQKARRKSEPNRKPSQFTCRSA